jgi:hypothetical protein
METLTDLHHGPGVEVISQPTGYWRWRYFFVWLGIIGLSVYGATSANGILTSYAIITLPIVISILWVRGEPPVLAFACGMQWLQASAAVFYTDRIGTSLTQVFGTHHLETASWLSLTAVLALAAGMRLALVRRSSSRQKLIEQEAAQVSLRKICIAYVISYVIGFEINNYAWLFPGFTQLLLPLAAVKWVFVFVVAYCVLEQERGYLLLVLMLVFEAATGLLGYFAGFKSVFFIVSVAALASPLALGVRRLLLVILAFCCLLAFGIFWSAIKMEYREYLNQGTGEQTVLVPMEDRAAKLGELADKFTWEDFDTGLDAMVLRVSYVYYFALALINVPDSVPYEGGALWGGTLKHVFMPRLLFPDKPILDDSERTRLYTGVIVSGSEQGTSIGIGYVGESYIDFGPTWMFAPILCLGVFYGFIYRFFAIRKTRILLGSAVASAILVFGAYTIETSNIKLVGGNLVAVLVLGGLYLAFSRPLHRWLTT